MNGCPVKVSVIVPVYNVEEYLSTCLNSCINQTLYDIEIICVNDGSTDGSAAILERFAQVDNRITVIHKKNGGLSSARNAGMRVANGKFVMFLDSDDYLSPNACERVWCESLEGDTDIVIFGTNIFPTKPYASDWHRRVLEVWTHRYYSFTPHVLFGEPSAKPFVWRQAFSKKLLDKSKLEFDESVKYGEDTVFQLEMFPHAENFAFIEDRLYNYRWYRQGSLMSTLRDDIDKRVSEHIRMCTNITEYWKKQGWLKEYGREFTEWTLEFIVPDIKSKGVKKANEHFKAYGNMLDTYNLRQYIKHVSPYFQNYVLMLPNSFYN